MIVTERHPLDGVLADLGSLVRRVRVGALDEEVYRFAAGRIRAELAEIDPHLAGRVSAALDQLEQVEESGRMTLGLFEIAAREIRDAITARRATQPQHTEGA